MFKNYKLTCKLCWSFHEKVEYRITVQYKDIHEKYFRVFSFHGTPTYGKIPQNLDDADFFSFTIFYTLQIFQF